MCGDEKGEVLRASSDSVLAFIQIQTKTVAQCVEFYYTYKKQVKIGRNGTLTFGDVDTSDEKSAQEEVEVDIKVSPSPTLPTSHLVAPGARPHRKPEAKPPGIYRTKDSRSPTAPQGLVTHVPNFEFSHVDCQCGAPANQLHPATSSEQAANAASGL